MQRRRLAAIATLPMAGFLLLAFPAMASAITAGANSLGVGIEVGAATLGVAAATKLQFTVGKAVPAGFWSRLSSPLAWAGGVIVLAGGAFLLVRRSGFRLRLERTPGEYGPADPGGGPQ